MSSNSMSNTSNPRGSRFALIRKLFRDPQPPLFADDHQLHALAPPLITRLTPNVLGLPRAYELSNILPSVVQPV